MRTRPTRLLSCVALLLPLLLGCRPRLTPMRGRPAPAVLPAAGIPRGHHRLVFQWALDDPDFSGRGEGAARLAHPDSARVDFFLAGGVGSGSVVLIGVRLRLPSSADAFSKRLIPAAPLLWAALGRAAVPAAPDTTVRVDGDTLRADIGNPVAWRLTFVRDSLRRVERVAGGRVQEWVARPANGRIRYRNEASRRTLDLTITRFDNVSTFDASIWILP